MTKYSSFTGTGTLLKLCLRRDRFLLPIWVLLPFFVTLGQVQFVTALPDWQNFITELSASPLTGILLGPIVPLSMAGAIIWRSSIQGAMIVALGSLLTVIRHTRTEEERGRSELIGGGMVGRFAGLTAALVVTNAASLLAGMLAAIGLIGFGLPAGGSLLFGLTMAAAGWFFAGAGAIGAQLRESAGGARGLAIAALGVAFFLSIWNNAKGAYTLWAWLTPLAWHRLTMPFADNQTWALLGFIALSALLTLLAYGLLAQRDMGSGLLKPQLGPATASPGLSSVLALAWRMNKGTLLSWVVGIALIGGGIGAVVPSISEDISQLLASMGSLEWMVKLGNRKAFMAVAVYILSLMAGISLYGIATVLRLRKEEAENLAEAILAKPVSRTRWMLSYLCIAFIGAAVLQAVLGLAAGLGWGLAEGNVKAVLPAVMGMSLTKIPVVWVMVGITALLYGLVPRLASVLSWGLLSLFIIIEMAWEAQVVDWSVMAWIPFSYVHYSIPLSELPLVPLVVLTGLAALFTGAGLFGFTRRSVGG